MGQRTKYTPGTFSWTDLTTPDQDGSKAFYTQLFGWDVNDQPMGEGAVYSTMLIDDTPVCALSPQPAQLAGMPPMWNSYITVDSADDSLARAKELGANLHAPAFDVLDVGRMGVVQDPQGAYFCLWQPRSHIGAGLVNGHGMLSWNELATTDIDAAARFYSELFGWKINSLDMRGTPYLTAAVEGHGNAGIRAVTPPDLPPHWLVYLGIDDLDAGLAKVRELGGKVMVEPIEIMDGSRVAVIQDPQDGIVALYSGRFED